MAQRQALTIRRAHWRESATMLERAAERGPGLGIVSAREVCEGRELYAAELGGRTVAYYALDRVEHEHGQEGVILALAGEHVPGVYLSASLLPFIEAQLADCDVIAAHTKRRALAKLLAVNGYTVDGFAMRKRVNRAKQ